MDANARVGSNVSEAIGDVDGVRENFAGAEMHAVLREHSLCLPATLVGEPGDGFTWISPDARVRRRLDYVAVPQAWLPRVAKAYVERGADLAIRTLSPSPLRGQGGAAAQA